MTMLKLFATILALAGLAFAGEECTALATNPDSKDPKDRVPPALKVLKDAKSMGASNACIVDAMRVIGSAKSEAAIPVVLSWLLWENKHRFPYGLETPGRKYPAIDALLGIGKPALPALLNVIASSGPRSIRGRNALDAFMGIHREVPREGIARLKQEALKHRGVARRNLQDSAKAAEKTWKKVLLQN